MARTLPALILAFFLCACADEGGDAPCVCPRGEACDDTGDCVPVDAGTPPRRDLGRQRLDLGPLDRAVRDLAPPRDAALPADREVRDLAPPMDHAVALDQAVDAAPPDAAPADLAPPDQSLPDRAVPDRGPPLAGYGEACRAAAECLSGLCVGDPTTGLGMCTSPCDTSATCPGTDVCLPVGAQRVCVRNETGRPCAGPADCVEGLCGDAQPAPVGWLAPSQICVARCTDDRKCPVGYRCGALNGVAERVCLPDVEVAALCPGGAAAECPLCPAPVDSRLCLSPQDFDGYCACACASAADCPRGWACHHALADTGDPARPGACVPVAGLRCAGQVQGGAVQCAGLDCSPAGPDPADAFCTAACRNDLDCPGAYVCRVRAGQALCVPPE
ncbi:MAG: hypothetical protein H6702_19605 [Myxococcales bacterium]|nr:hypothetical protein [Myxococcales bacterium]